MNDNGFVNLIPSAFIHVERRPSNQSKIGLDLFIVSRIISIRRVFIGLWMTREIVVGDIFRAVSTPQVRVHQRRELVPCHITRPFTNPLGYMVFGLFSLQTTRTQNHRKSTFFNLAHGVDIGYVMDDKPSFTYLHDKTFGLKSLQVIAMIDESF